MERLTINSEVRTATGKGVARSLRRAGRIPAVMYGLKQSTPIEFDRKELVRFINATSGDQIPVNVKFKDGQKLALIKEYQTDPIDGSVLHVDFLEISLTEKIKVMVSVKTVGEPIGVKRDKGIIQYGIRSIEVECLPGDIPSHVELDISELECEMSMHVGDIEVPDTIEILTSLKELTVQVVMPKIEVEEVEEPEEGVEAAEGEEGAEGKTAEGEEQKEAPKKEDS